MGILRQAKNPVQSKPLIIQYQFARRCIAACLQSPIEASRIIGAAIAALEQRRDDHSSSPLICDDAARSIEVIQTFQRTINALDVQGYRYEVPKNQNSVMAVSGVEISVWPDAIAQATVRGVNRIGEVFLRCTIGIPGDAAEDRRSEANGHLATIAHMHTIHALAERGTPHAPSSMVIDVSRELVVRGSVNISRRVANIETACTMIAAIWPRA